MVWNSYWNAMDLLKCSISIECVLLNSSVFPFCCSAVCLWLLFCSCFLFFQINQSSHNHFQLVMGPAQLACFDSLWPPVSAEQKQKHSPVLTIMWQLWLSVTTVYQPWLADISNITPTTPDYSAMPLSNQICKFSFLKSPQELWISPNEPFW